MKDLLTTISKSALIKFLASSGLSWLSGFSFALFTKDPSISQLSAFLVLAFFWGHFAGKYLERMVFLERLGEDPHFTKEDHL